MCTAPRKPSPACGPVAASVTDYERLSTPTMEASLLLELSASDDLPAFKHAVEANGLPVYCAARWYCRSLSPSRQMKIELRTPLMIAASYGSLSVLNYILALKTVRVNQRCGSDGATALHCAAASGSTSAVDAITLLIGASADLDIVDGWGNRPADLIPRQVSGVITKSLEAILRAPNPSRPSSPETAVAARVSPTKKQYPPNFIFRDIKNGIYSTDEFRMYKFKIQPCLRSYRHDWKECPFVHPGDNARRRDPRKYRYSCLPCLKFRSGACRNGDACEYAHGTFERWLHPAQYRTSFCKDVPCCNRRDCFFAHKPDELRIVSPSTVSTSLNGSIFLPRSPSINGGVSSTDMAAALLIMQQQPRHLASSAISTTTCMREPSAIMTRSQLKYNLNTRDMDLGQEPLDLEGHQRKLINEITTAASPRLSWQQHTANIPLVSNNSDPFGSLDSTVLSQLQGLLLKQMTGGAKYLTPTAGIQKLQFLSSFGNSVSPVSESSSIGGLDQSLANTIMNSRASSFAKRSQSFVDGGELPRYPNLTVSPPLLLSSPTTAGLSNLSTPTGKLDWGTAKNSASCGSLRHLTTAATPLI